MRLSTSFLVPILSILSCATASPLEERHRSPWGWGSWWHGEDKIVPKVFIISMFEPEAAAWWGIKEFDILAKNITVTGFSPVFPDAHCTKNGEICQVIVGEGEINAASTMMALLLSPLFDLKKTYFMVAGIAGINPEIATICSVTFARYAVQVALQYEFDAREMPANFSAGYFPFGTSSPDAYPVNIYGTEIFELNAALQAIALDFAKTATLNDSAAAIDYRAKYAPVSAYAAGAAAPAVVACDVATSDVYYSGAILSEAFGAFAKLVSNGSATYCSAAQEDNATLEAMVRAAKAGLMDFARVIVMRTASDFDRPPPGVSPIQNLRFVDQGAFFPALANLYLAGIPIVEGILTGWEGAFESGIKPTNYVGDIFETLGGTPDFGPPGVKGSTNLKKRSSEEVMRQRMRRAVGGR